MFSKIRTLRQSWLLTPFWVFCVWAFAACTATESGRKTPITIAGVVISKTGQAGHRQAIDQFMIDKTADVIKISSKFSTLLLGHLALEKDKLTTINAMPVPTLSLNGMALNQDHAIPEKFSAEIPGAIATLFVRSGDEFIRISTSLKKTGRASPHTSVQEPAIGSPLSHSHPAYQTCMNGNTFVGTDILLNAIYMTEYTPIKNANGNVIGIRLVGLDISGDLVSLKRKLFT